MRLSKLKSKIKTIPESLLQRSSAKTDDKTTRKDAIRLIRYRSRAFLMRFLCSLFPELLK